MSSINFLHRYPILILTSSVSHISSLFSILLILIFASNLNRSDVYLNHISTMFLLFPHTISSSSYTILTEKFPCINYTQYPLFYLTLTFCSISFIRTFNILSSIIRRTPKHDTIYTFFIRLYRYGAIKIVLLSTSYFPAINHNICLHPLLLSSDSRHSCEKKLPLYVTSLIYDKFPFT